MFSTPRAPVDQAGLNSGNVSRGVTASNTTSTDMPALMSYSAPSIRFVVKRSCFCSANATTASTYGTLSTKNG